MNKKKREKNIHGVKLRVPGIEPGSPALCFETSLALTRRWQADIIPLDHTRFLLEDFVF